VQNAYKTILTFCLSFNCLFSADLIIKEGEQTAAYYRTKARAGQLSKIIKEPLYVEDCHADDEERVSYLYRVAPAYEGLPAIHKTHTIPVPGAISCKAVDGQAEIKYRFPDNKTSLFDKIFTRPIVFIAGAVVGSLVTVGIMK